jgi:hypothetical protein
MQSFIGMIGIEMTTDLEASTDIKMPTDIAVVAELNVSRSMLHEINLWRTGMRWQDCL